MNARPSRLPLLALPLLALPLIACDSATLPTNIAVDGLYVEPEPDVSVVDMGALDLAPPQDMLVVDMMVAPDMMVEPDMEPPVGGAIPDGPSCDPRLRAQSCEQGASCWQRPGAYAHQGNCVTGDGCDVLTNTGCPPERPLCQLDGRATRCVEPPEPALTEGEPCLTETNRALPCGEGLVCNLSVCMPACDPSLDPTSPEGTAGLCPDSRPCLDLSERVGSAVGYCGFLGQCNPFNGGGCQAGESCRFAMRPDDLKIVTFCTAEGLLGADESCVEGGVGEQGCATGYTCIGAPGAPGTCRRICDTGAYLSACPDNQACQEILSLGPNLPIRGIGLCITNQ